MLNSAIKHPGYGAIPCIVCFMIYRKDAPRTGFRHDFQLRLDPDHLSFLHWQGPAIARAPVITALARLPATISEWTRQKTRSPAASQTGVWELLQKVLQPSSLGVFLGPRFDDGNSFFRVINPELLARTGKRRSCSNWAIPAIGKGSAHPVIFYDISYGIHVMSSCSIKYATVQSKASANAAT